MANVVVHMLVQPAVFLTAAACCASCQVPGAHEHHPCYLFVFLRVPSPRVRNHIQCPPLDDQACKPYCTSPHWRPDHLDPGQDVRLLASSIDASRLVKPDIRERVGEPLHTWPPERRRLLPQLRYEPERRSRRQQHTPSRPSVHEIEHMPVDALRDNGFLLCVQVSVVVRQMRAVSVAVEVVVIPGWKTAGRTRPPCCEDTRLVEREDERR